MTAMKNRDIESPNLGELDWAPGARAKSLSTLFDHTVKYAVVTEDWYARHRRAKRYWGRALRVGAILLGAAAAIIPILAEIFTDGGEPRIAPAWASVALAAAATLLALDRYFGFSAGWMRFMTTWLYLMRLRHDFEAAWQKARAAGSDPPGEDDVAERLALARELVLAVDGAIIAETGAWVTEFQANLERTEQSLRQQERA